MADSRASLLRIPPAFVAAAIALALGACQLQASLDGRFSCSEPPHECPYGLVCDRQLQCVEPTSATADAAIGPAPVFDAGVTPPAPDSGALVPEPDASFDAGEVPPVTLDITLGERSDALIHNVTIDSNINEDNPTANHGGAGGMGIDAQPRETGLLQFDLTSLPLGATCLSAELEMSVSDPIETGDYQIYPLLEAWVESEVTWNVRKSGRAWSDPGAGPGSRSSVPMGSTAPRSPGTITVTLDPVVVQQWIQDPSSNHGMAWVSTSPDGRGGEFRSSENSDATLRPLLHLVLSP
jgi:hypothetical protein